MPLIIFASATGGAGCSTAAGHCAHLMQKAGHSCLAIDASPNHGLSLSLGLAEIPLHGWATHAMAKSHWASSVLQAPDHLQLLPFGTLPTLPDAHALHMLGQWLRSSTQVCVVDVGPHLMAYAPALLGQAHALIVCTRAQAYAQQQLQQLLDDVAPLMPAQCVQRILTGRYDVRRHSQKQVLAQMNQAWPALFFEESVHEDEQLADSMAQGIPVFLRYPQSQSAHDLQGISHRLMQLLALPQERQR